MWTNKFSLCKMKRYLGVNLLWEGGEGSPAPSRLVVDDRSYLGKILNAMVYDVEIETDLQWAENLSDLLNSNALLKTEDTQTVFSFKILGAYNAMASLPPSSITHRRQALILLIINNIILLLRNKEEDELVFLLLNATMLVLILLVDKLPLPRRRTGLSSSSMQTTNMVILLIMVKLQGRMAPIENVLDNRISNSNKTSMKQRKHQQ